ncbi:hypothetical protein [Aeromonas jandaei]|uniref:hypothetical protein n=1 Tax=Aeromonas jandaei TaxID=650 RepID=UPI003987D82C
MITPYPDLFIFYCHIPYGKVTAEWEELGRETHYEYHPGLHLVSRRINLDGYELKYRYDNAKLFLS